MKNPIGCGAEKQLEAFTAVAADDNKIGVELFL
jgi:hypothetical protein